MKSKKTDIPNLRQTLEEWKIKLPDLMFHLQTPPTESRSCLSFKDSPFLLVIQTAEQRQLLERYGNEVVCLDATYKTTMYDLPLYFIAVPTNTIYMVVGMFIPKFNTSDGIAQALALLKEWNPTWYPSRVMTDYCASEIDAIGRIFPGKLPMLNQILYCCLFYLPCNLLFYVTFYGNHRH